MNIRDHLLPESLPEEQAAFMFLSATSGTQDFLVREIWLLTHVDFVIQSRFHIELTEWIWARAIKYAHDSAQYLGEIHSHRSSELAPRFSLSDVTGFRDNVPYVRWRLRNTPYIACVIAPTGIDGWYWFGSSDRPTAIAGISTEAGIRMLPSGLSNWDEPNGNY